MLADKDSKDFSLKYLNKLKAIVLQSSQNSANTFQKKISEFAQASVKGGSLYLNNVVKYCLTSADSKDLNELKALYLFRIQNAIKSISSADSAIISLAMKKIPKGGAVFVHGNNQLALDILQSALKEKKFSILTVSSNDFLISGMKKAKNKFQCFSDRAVKAAVEAADLVLLCSHAVTPAKIIHPVGGEIVAEIAHSLNVPVYVCIPAMSFSKEFYLESHKIMQGDAVYHLFDDAQIEPSFVTGIISELGIYGHDIFVHTLEKELPWLFTS